LDGADDLFSLVNTASLDITVAPLAVFATIKTPAILQTEYVFCKNVDSVATVQYGLGVDSDGYVASYLEGVARQTTANSLIANTVYNIGFIWDGTNIKNFINKVQSGITGTFSGSLTSRANVRIGCRGNNSVFYKGGIATLTVYAGAKAIEANILKAETAISKAYL
jgi:hypothetical protein